MSNQKRQVELDLPALLSPDPDRPLGWQPTTEEVLSFSETHTVPKEHADVLLQYIIMFIAGHHLLSGKEMTDKDFLKMVVDLNEDQVLGRSYFNMWKLLNQEWSTMLLAWNKQAKFLRDKTLAFQIYQNFPGYFVQEGKLTEEQDMWLRSFVSIAPQNQKPSAPAFEKPKEERVLH